MGSAQTSSALPASPAVGSVSRGRQGRFPALLREPLTQFLLAGALLFIVGQWLDEQRSRTARTVVVDADRIARISALYRSQMGRTPHAALLQRLVDDDVRNEVLYREALRRGLDRDDEIVRRRLIQKLEYLELDLAHVQAPSEAELQTYLATHPERFRTPERVAFEQRFFASDRDGDAGAHRRAEYALQSVGAPGANPRDDGDRFPGDVRGLLERSDLLRTFGETPMVDAALGAPVGAWRGPYRSGYGWHLIRVSQREAARDPGIDEVRDSVRAAWLEECRAAARDAAIATMLADYRVVRSDGAR